MPVTAVVFDIGGVLEIVTPRPLVDLWEPRFSLEPVQAIAEIEALLA